MRLLFLSLAMFFLTSCGHEFCFGPFGTCYEVAKGAGNQGGSSGTLKVTYQDVYGETGSLVIPIGTAVTLTAQGGNSTQYLWKRDDNSDDDDYLFTGTTYGTSTVYKQGGTVQIQGVRAGFTGKLYLEDADKTVIAIPFSVASARK